MLALLVGVFHTALYVLLRGTAGGFRARLGVFQLLWRNGAIGSGKMPGVGASVNAGVDYTFTPEQLKQVRKAAETLVIYGTPDMGIP